MQPNTDFTLDPYHSKFPLITWSNASWYLKKTPQNSKCGPGPNIFSSSNISLLPSSFIQLSLTHTLDSSWHCCQLISKQIYLFGDFEWVVEGNLSDLDKNIVFAMFLYPTNQKVAEDGTNEIDIEFARWGQEKEGNLDYTLFSGGKEKEKPISSCQVFGRRGEGSEKDVSRHRIRWREDGIWTQSICLNEQTEGEEEWQSSKMHKFETNSQDQVPQIPLRCHVNLWLFKGQPPSNTKQVQIKIKSFKYYPISIGEK